MSQVFYDRWFPGEANHLPGFFAEVERLLPGSGRILDLGCGANHHLARFRSAGREVWGADLERHPELLHPEWFRLIGPDGKIPFADGSLDLVSTFMVAEHVGRPGDFLGEVERVLRPGGHFVVHTISGLHYVTWIRRAFAAAPHSWTQRLVRRLYGREEHDTFPTYYRMNTPARITRHVRSTGLEPVGVRRYACQGYFAFSGLLYRSAVVADWLLDHVCPGLGRIYFTATYRKAAGAAPAVPAAAA